MNLESMTRYLQAFGSAVLLAMVVVPALQPAEVRATTPASFAQANDSGDDTQQDPEKEEERATGAKKSKEKKEGDLQLDPELKKRIDEFMEAHKDDVQHPEPPKESLKPSRRTTPPVSKARRTRPTPAATKRPEVSRPGSKPAASKRRAEPPHGETTKIDIPPSDDGVAPEERTYRFSIKDGTYEQLVEGFSRQTGLGVIGQAPKDGKVTFVSTEELSFEEAFGRVRMLLFKYKPHEPYWLDRQDTHLEVIRVTDIYRVLPIDRMFSSVDAYRAAELPNEELALVVYRAQSGSLADLRVVRDWLPDYVRVTPMEERNAVTIFALVRDIEKYLSLIKWVEGIGRADARTLEAIEIKWILPSEAITKLEALMVLGGGTRPRTPRGAARGKDASPLVTMPEPDVSLLPDDAQGVLIVRAMQDKIGEIKELLPFIDVDTTLSGVKPVVIPVERADPGELADMIRQILAVYSQPGGEAGAAPSPSTRRKARPGSRPSPASALSDGVTLIVHPSQPAIIAIGEEEDLQQVRELVAQFDVGQVGPLRIDLAHTEATELITTLTLVLGGTGMTRKGSAPIERYKLVPDPGNQALWFTGDEQDLEKVREMVGTLDVAGQEVLLHVVPLRKRKPSFVTSMLREFESSAPTPAASSGKGKARQSKVRGRTVTASKFTPDDEHKLLYILCTKDELQEYMAFIERLEDAVVDTAVFQRIPVENVDAETAIGQLEAVLGGPGGRAEDVRYVPTDGGILVVGATQDVVDDIMVVLEEFDHPVEIEKRIFDIVFADPAEIRTAVEALLGEGAGGKSPAGRRRPGRPDAKGAAPAAPSVSPEMTIVQMDTRLIVHATPQRMVEVAELIAELDVERAASTETRVYADFAPETDIGAISDVLTSFFTGSGPKAPRKAKGPQAASSQSPRFMPLPDVGKLMVVAESELFPRIEEMIELLRVDVEITPFELAMVDVMHADPGIVVEQISPLLDLFVRRLVARGELPAMGEPARATPKTKSVAGKRAAVRSTATGAHYHLDADEWNSRIVVAAPQVVVDYARDLIERFDMPHDDAKVVMQTVPLEYAGCAEMVKALREMSGASPISTRGKKTRKGGGPTETDAGPPLMIVEAPSGSSVILKGLPEDVEEALAWLEQLDVASTQGRLIKVYEVLYADIKTLATLIMNVVDQPAGPAVAGKAPRRRGKAAEPLEEESLFEVTKTWVGQDIYIQADLMVGTMIVATTEAKMVEIDGIVAQFDRAGLKGVALVPVPKFTYTLQHVEAIDAEFAADMVFEQLWEPRDKLPKVEAAFWGDYLIVSYHDEDRFAEIEAMIREHVDVVDPTKKEIRKTSLMSPSSTRPSELAAWILRNHPEIPIEVVDVSTMQDQTWNLEQVKPPLPEPDGCVMPLAFARTVADMLAVGAIGQDDPRGGDDPQGDKVDPADEKLPVSTDDVLRDIGRSMLDANEEESRGEAKTSGFFGQGQKLRIEINDDTGALTVIGPAGVLDEIDDWVEDFEEEIEKLTLPPDIRIVRVRHIDVYSAAEILEEMFNATRQQRQVLQQQQRLAQQRQRQLQQQQRRQQQQQQGQQGGQQPGQTRRPGQPGQQQQQAPTLQLPPTAVRIYPNPRDRTLILRAETNQYPTIFELLATIDQPKPMDSEFRIYKLDKLNASEVEEVLNEFLGLGQRSRGRTTSPQPQRAGRSQPTRTTSRTRDTGGGGDLPQRIMQETITGSMLGLDAGDIKLSSNEEANTIVAMAPPAALDFIGDLIKQLESEGLPERLTSYYELQHADVGEVAEYLEMHFSESGSSGSRGLGKSKKGGGPSSTLNSPSFVSYPRLNMLTVLATEEQLAEIDGLIERLDVSSGQDQWNHVMLVRADAGVVADKLSQMFGGSGGSSTKGGGGRRPKLGSVSGNTVAFIGDEGGRMLLYSAPDNLRESILGAIEKFEAEAEDRSILRTIELTYATPSKVAEVIESAYGGSSGTSRGRGGRGRATSSQTRFTITPDDSTRRLFVLADDSMYPDIESLAKALDQPADIGFEFRIYMLQHADAREIHTIMTTLITDYFRQMGRGGGEREPFSVEVNDRTNSLIVLGSPTVFGFIETNLAKIDTPSNAATPPTFLIRSLTNADATEVAQMINRLWATQSRQRGAQGSSETPPMAEANRALNMLIVRGTQEQIDEIRREVLDPMEEEAGPILLTESIKLEHAEPEAVADLINVIFEDKKRAFQSLGNVGRTMPLQFTVIVTPDISTRQVIVQAGKENMELVKARIAELDREDVAASLATDIRIYRPQYADAGAVADIVNNWGRTKSSGSARTKGGSAGAAVQAVAEPMTQSLVVTTTGSNHLIIAELLERLDVESNFATEIHRVQLANADADQLATSLQDTFRADSSSKGTSSAVQVFPELGTNSLLVTCNLIQWGYVLPLIESLDVPGKDDQQREIRIVSLLYADAMELQGAMEEYLRKRSGRGGGGGELAGDMRVSVLEQSNAVVISGETEEVDQLEATVRALDDAGIGSSVPKIIQLEHAKVSRILPTLQDMFLSKSGGRSAKKPPMIQAHDAGNFLLVLASAGDMAAIEGTVAALDQEGIPVDQPFRIIQVAAGINVTDMAEDIEQIINEGSSAMSGSDGEALHLTAIADTRSHSIMLAGSPVLITQAEEMIHILEGMGPAGGMAMRIIDLNQVPAEDVERLIQQLKGEESGRSSTRSRSGTSRSRSGSSGTSSRPRTRTRRP